MGGHGEHVYHTAADIVGLANYMEESLRFSGELIQAERWHIALL